MAENKLHWTDKSELLREQLRRWRRTGARIGLVPTMGYLHNGHLALVREAQRLSDRVVVTIFVNPLQFGPTDDLARYPRDLEGDRQKLERVGASLVYVPAADTLYLPNHCTTVSVADLSKTLEGAHRPDHFVGVATIVAKLFNLIQPDVAIFGEKDFQQLAVIRCMVRDLNIPVEVIGMPTIRDLDGLAMSSRNSYLSVEERSMALSLSRAIRIAQQAATSGERNADRLIEVARYEINSHPTVRIDYIAIINPMTFEPVDNIEPSSRILLAAWVGKTRLIDNDRLLLAQPAGN